MTFLQKLPAKLVQRAYYSLQEAAWSRHDAVAVVDHLSQSGITVIGAEIWLPTEPGPTIPTPFIYTWEADARMDGESKEQYILRSNSGAKNYINSFCWDEKDIAHKSCEPYFNLTVDDDRTPAE